MRRAGAVHLRPLQLEAVDIFGALLREWFRGDFGLLFSGANAVRWQSLVSATVLAPAVSNNTTGLGPTRATVRGRPAVSGDGTQNMWGTMAVPAAAGERPYMWCVAQPNGTPATATIRRAVSITNPSIVNVTVGVYAFTGTPPTHHANTISSATLTDGSEAFNTLAWDLLPHLVEYGALATTTAKARVDGTGYNGTRTGALLNPCTDLRLFNNSATALVADMKVAEVGCLSGPPSAKQLSDLLSYYQTRYAA